eukprot:SAG31_NODE_6259_length_2099_cov_1.561500_2_plen_154_part_00
MFVTVYCSASYHVVLCRCILREPSARLLCMTLPRRARIGAHTFPSKKIGISPHHAVDEHSFDAPKRWKKELDDYVGKSAAGDSSTGVPTVLLANKVERIRLHLRQHACIQISLRCSVIFSATGLARRRRLTNCNERLDFSSGSFSSEMQAVHR